MVSVDKSGKWLCVGKVGNAMADSHRSGHRENGVRNFTIKYGLANRIITAQWKGMRDVG